MSLAPFAPSQWFNSLGDPLSYGKLYWYKAGTLIAKETYADSAQTVLHTNPIVLDSAGRANVWLIDNEAYDLVMQSADGSESKSVLGIVVGSGSGSGSSSGAFEIQSFTDGGMLVAGGADIWDDGCFVWILPAANLSAIKYFKMSSCGHAGGPGPGGKFAIYKFEGDGTAAERIYQGVIPDGSSIGVQSLSLDVTGSLFVAVACDAAGSTIIPELVKQTRLTTPSVTSAGFPDSFQYIGTHTHNADFPINQLPTVKGADPIYQMTKWMALGVVGA